jgi:Zn ribbon nucleic-acid-binding protein
MEKMENSTRCACVADEGEVKIMRSPTCETCGSTAVIWDDYLKQYKCVDCGYKFPKTL